MLKDAPKTFLFWVLILFFSGLAMAQGNSPPEVNVGQVLDIYNLGVEEFNQFNHLASQVHFKSVLVRTDGAQALSLMSQYYLALLENRMGHQGIAIDLLDELASKKLPRALEEAVKRDLEELNDLPEIKRRLLNLYKKNEYGKLLASFPTGAGSEDPNLLLLKGLAQQRLKNTEDSDLTFDTLVNMFPNSSAANQVRNLKDKVNPSEFWLSIELGMGGSDNVYATPQTESAVVGKTAKPTGRFSAFAGYRLLDLSSVTLNLSYNFRIFETFDLVELRDVQHSFQLPIIYEKEGNYLSLNPYIKSLEWAGQLALTKNGGRVKYISIGADWDWGAMLEVYNQNAQQTIYNYLSGSGAQLRFPLTYKLQSSAWVLSFNLGQLNISDEDYTNGTLPSKYVSQGISLQRIVRNLSWRHDLSFDFENKRYANASTFNNKKRIDTGIGAYYRVDYVQGRLSYFAEVNYLQNTSTFGASDLIDKNFNESSAMLGLSAELLD